MHHKIKTTITGKVFPITFRGEDFGDPSH